MVSSSRARPPRGDRFPDAGRSFHVTLFTERRTRHLSPLPVARSVVRALAAAAAEALTRTLAWTVLPDQVQWVFVLGDFTELARPIRAVKTRSAAEIVPRLMLAGPLWQPAFAEERLPDDAAVEARARAVVAAPLHKRLVREIGAWSHWDTTLPSVLRAAVAGELVDEAIP